MVLYNLGDYTNETILEALGFASDSGEPMANSHSKQVPGYDEILPCACEECLEKFHEEMNTFGDEEYDDESPEEYLAESLDEATMEVIENFVFLGEGTSTKDVMISILALESVIAQIKMHLLESE